MKNNLFISKDKSVRMAMEKLNFNTKRILYVLEDERLVGALTDGDIRRFLLSGQSMELSLYHAMNKNPITITEGERGEAKMLMIEKSIQSVPIIDDERRVLDVLFLFEEETYQRLYDTPVVIMAGGKGTRLYPLTEDTPKPLVNVGEVPIIERIMKRFLRQGFYNFILSVGHKKEQVVEYFKDKDYDVTFIHEDSPLGTAGSLSLMKEYLHDYFILTNCDILIDLNYYSLVERLRQGGEKLLAVLARHESVIPYGVMEVEGQQIVSFTEKPTSSVLINTGLYALDPTLIPEEVKSRSITEIFEHAIQNHEAGAYIINDDNWLDMGQKEEMQRMIERLGL